MDNGNNNNTAKPSSSNEIDNDNRTVTRSRSRSLPKASRNQTVFDNLLRGKSSRSRTSRDNNEEVPEPVMESTDTVRTTHEELHKIQQVCQQENENIRKEVQSITDKVSCLKSEQTPTNGQEQATNASTVIDALSSVIEKKFDNLSKSQPDFTKLVDEQQKSILHNLPSRVAERHTRQAQSYNRSRSTRRTHMTTTQSYIRNCR